MGCYYERISTEQPELNAFPALDVEQTNRDVNALFTPYIFVKREGKNGKRIWTSCCNTETFWEELPRECTPAHLSVWFGEHNFEATCPFCGRKVKIKETRYIRPRNSLTEYAPIIIISEQSGTVYARGYWARKVYEGDFAAPPQFLIRYAYKFTPGEVTEWTWGMFGGTYKRKIHPGYSPKSESVRETFYGSSGRIEAYNVLGADNIENSFLQYTGWREYMGKRKYQLHLMNFLCLASMYPRKVEMLMKTGQRELVENYVNGWKKNARVIDWECEEDNFLAAFGLNKKEWNDYRKSGAAPGMIEYYKALRKAKLETTFDILKTISREGIDLPQLVKICKKHKQKPEKVMRWLDKFTGSRCHGGYFGLRQAFKMWMDYLDMAKFLQMDLKEHNVIFPKNLELAHNEAATEQARLLQIEEDKKNEEEAARKKEMLDKWRLKYNFENETHFIRIAENRQEIITEGKTLEHCVGGYAGRHMEGITTILFLRRKDMPNAALYTIEMHGNALIQIHGFKNEMKNGKRIATDPREVMKEMLDTWLDWLKRGSPRTKTGTPKLRKKKKESAA